MAWDLAESMISNIMSKSIYEHIKNFSVDIEAELEEAFIGTVPKDKGVYSSYIVNKLESKFILRDDPDEFVESKNITKISRLPDDEKEQILSDANDEEVDSVVGEDEDEIPRKTGFHKDNDGVFFFNYMMIGNIKSNIKILKDSGAITVSAYKKACDTCLEILPRKIRFYTVDEPLENLSSFRQNKDEGVWEQTEIYSILKRPLRANTPKGDRTAIVTSETIPEKTRFKFKVTLFRNNMGLTPENLILALKVGSIHGMGQWRGSGCFGRYKILSVKKVNAREGTKKIKPDAPKKTQKKTRKKVVKKTVELIKKAEMPVTDSPEISVRERKVMRKSRTRRLRKKDDKGEQ